MPQGNAKDVIKESTPAGGGFACFFSLQAGTVMAACTIFGICLIAFFYNLSAPNPTMDTGQYTCQYVLSYLTYVIVFFGAIVTSLAAFKFSSRWVLVGTIIMTVAGILWFLLSLLSFIPSIGVYPYVCVHTRCPPTVWLFEVYWRPPPDNSTNDDTAPATTDGKINRTSGGGRMNPENDITITSSMDNNGGPDNVWAGSEISNTTIVTTRNQTLVTGTQTSGFRVIREVKEDATVKRYEGDILLGDVSVTESNAMSDSLERPPSSVPPIHGVRGTQANPWFSPNSVKLWDWIPRANLHVWAKKPAKRFVSSYVHQYDPDKTDSSLAMSIFCFVVFILFWVYSLWTFFSYYKELRGQEKEEKALSHRQPSAPSRSSFPHVVRSSAASTHE